MLASRAHPEGEIGSQNIRPDIHAGLIRRDVEKACLGAGGGAKTDDPAGAGSGRAGAMKREIRIIGVQDGGAAGGQPVKDLCLGGGDVIKTVEKAGVAVGNARDDRDIRLGKGAERPDFPRRVHTDFLHGGKRRVGKCRQRQWHAKMIVEAGAVGMTSAKPAQHMGQHFLASCLADRTGDGHEMAAGHAMCRPAKGAKSGQRGLDIINPQQWARY